MKWFSFIIVNLSFMIPISVQGMIPQIAIQEVLIEGELNEVDQEIQQTISFNFISLPSLEASIIPVLNLRGNFITVNSNSNNLIDQQLNQTVFGLDSATTDLNGLDVNYLFDSNDISEGSHFNLQTAFLKGNDNNISQKSQQELNNIFYLNPLSNTIDLLDLNVLFKQIMENSFIDFLQLSLQDTVILGNNNLVSQTIEQRIEYTILTNNDFSQWIDNLEEDLNIFQLTIQETFMDNNNNLIHQNINQFIHAINWFYFTDTDPSLSSPITPSNDPNLDFDIDLFINRIANQSSINATQINRQDVETIGENNQTEQNSLQILSKTIPEPSSLKMLLLIAITGFIGFVRKSLYP
ncbi:hypothetical protein [Cyanothece sp. BG0011]|uniref:hypothetical protein n=1 Tax=Cyanothece sp. BG0011 TaxID=2082950 RepID=UPI000D1F0C91|nr:hypothetical protein [Cyanothece sp. BG0011]